MILKMQKKLKERKKKADVMITCYPTKRQPTADKATVDVLFPSNKLFIKNDYKNGGGGEIKKKKEKIGCDDHMLSNKATADKATVIALFISNKGPLFFLNFELPPVATAISA